MNKKLSSVPTPQTPQISEQTLQRMLALQESKIALELKQTELASKEIDHNSSIADKSIAAQAADRKDERAVQRAMHLHRLVFAGFVVLVVVALIIVALLNDKDAIVLDLTKVIFGFVGGWGASAAWRSRQKSPPPDAD
ncbi:hypothetical protein CLI92_08990 [Vandammella animalimorsus]|uniref:Uncharacterized protein n=1 Tax=Vandammella animalimorsus TaxID=2029117 RepID=A0A2A2T4M6_9BURK|nr:hypothetical protein [Vandammella animalimorsus]PAT31894.1 hypothetical protein CK626_07815 [Vandammella animalimorsus]PAX16459.1 hypothetical protein CLI92_08990 [Vandammella animalimorsus]PAX18874.1 hypothetical protein CLI93_11070 [Vandammella animalimorsus]